MPINQNQFWDMWNKFSIKQQTLPIQNGDIWRAHFENLYKDIPINQINSDQRIIIQEKFHTLEETIKDNQNLLVFPLLGKNWPHRQNLSSRGKLVVQTALKTKCSNAAPQRCRAHCLSCSILYYSQDVFLTSCAKRLISPIRKSGTNQTLITTVASLSGAVWVNCSVVFSIKE